MRAVISLRGPMAVKRRPVAYANLFWPQSSTCRRVNLTQNSRREKIPLLIEESYEQRNTEVAESKEQQISNVCNAWHRQKWQRLGISVLFSLFMYLWHAINLSRLDREITPCLPANELGAFLSSPYLLFTSLCDVKVKFTA